MNKPPAFQFYADDFLGGTVAMTNNEKGMYVTALCVQWNKGGISEEEMDRLGRGMAVLSIANVKAKFFLGSDGLFRNKRLELERRKQKEFRENRKKSGEKGAKSRWHSHSTAIAQPMANGMAKHSSPSPSPSPIYKAYNKGATKLKKDEWETAKRFEDQLSSEWTNDAGKWVNRIKSQTAKCERVVAEVESAAKEQRIKTTPARYAEQIWKEFR